MKVPFWVKINTKYVKKNIDTPVEMSISETDQHKTAALRLSRLTK